MNYLNQVFDKIFWINSKNRVDRYKNMVDRLKFLELAAERFSAIHGGELDHRYLNFGSKNQHIKDLNNGEIGCFQSHVDIYKLAKKEGWDKVLILEDDALFSPDFNNRFEKTYPNVPDDWDMLYLGQWNYDHEINGGNDVGGGTYALKENIAGNVFRADRAWLTHAYAVRQKALDYIIEGTSGMYSSLDNVLADIQKNLKVYAIHPALIVQDGTKSSLR